MNRPFRGFQRRLLAALFALGGVSLLTVCSDVSAPERAQRGHVAFAPTMSGASAAALGSSSTVIDNVRIIIRTLDGTVVLDTVVVFPANADEVAIDADIPVHGDNERFRATIQLRSGDNILFEGTQDLDVRAGQQSGAPASIPVQYVGTGSNATSVTIAPGSVSLVGTGSQQLTATVRDAGGNIIQNVPLGWTSSNEGVVSVSEDGLVSAKNVRGSATITATTFGGVAANASANVTLPPSQLRVAGGSGQTGRVGDPLPLPLVVELLASDGVGVPNATVTFSTTGTGASISPSTATTDENGRAIAALTLGTTAGPFTYNASSSGFTAAATATGIAGEPNRIAVAGGNAQSALTGTALPTPLSVRVTDEFGNPGANRQVNWTAVTGGSLTTATSTTNASGVATNGYTLPNLVGENTVYATLSGGGGVSFTAFALQRPPSTITVVSGGSQAGAAGTAAQPLLVRVTDALSQPVPNAQVTWTLNGTATIGAPASSTNGGGFTSIAAGFGTVVGVSTVTASITGATSAQFSLTTTPGAPASLVIVAGDNQTGPPGVAVNIAPSVRLSDAFGNPIVGATVNFGGATGGGSVTGGVQVTNALGVATVGSWVLGGFTPAQTLTANAGLLSVVFNATTSIVSSASSLSMQSGDGQVVTTFQPLQPLVVQALDFSESGVPGVPIKFTVTTGTATPAVFSTVTDSAGMAAFFPTSGTAGPNVVTACIMPACAITATFTFNTITSGSIWTGNVSTDWFTPGNWTTGVVPGPASNVYIPATSNNIVVLTGNTVMNEFFMASGSLISIGIFEMQIGSKVTTTGGLVLGTGSFRLTALSAPITGSLPTLILDGTATATGTVQVAGNVTVEGGGRLDIAAGADMSVSGGFTVDGAGRLTMNAATGTLTVNGDAYFAGQDMGDTELTAGLLDVKGNFTGDVYNQGFRAAGTHTTRLSGTGMQTISFFLSGAAFGRFQNLEITNISANGVNVSPSNVYVNGTLSQAGKLTVFSPRVFTVAGFTTLQAGSITNVTGSFVPAGGCVNLGGTATGFTC